MTYDRLDGQCKAKVLAIAPDGVLLKATWPHSKRDVGRFQINHGIASNIVKVPLEYFERKYGKTPDAN